MMKWLRNVQSLPLCRLVAYSWMIFECSPMTFIISISWMKARTSSSDAPTEREISQNMIHFNYHLECLADQSASACTCRHGQASQLARSVHNPSASSASTNKQAPLGIMPFWLGGRAKKNTFKVERNTRVNSLHLLNRPKLTLAAAKKNAKTKTHE